MMTSAAPCPQQVDFSQPKDQAMPSMISRHPVPQQSMDDEIVFPMEGENLLSRVWETSQYSIAQGGFTDVYKGVLQAEPKSVPVAIKILRGVHTDDETRKEVSRRILRESRVWSCLNHPYVQPYFGYCLIPEASPSLGLVSPFCGNGTIVEYLQKRPDMKRLHLLLQVASGLKYLHDHHVIHGDLSGNNVLIDDEGNAQITDFGRASVLDTEEFMTSLIAGSVDFIAPELFSHGETQEEADNSNFSSSSDIYAFSMLIFQVLTDQIPMIVGPRGRRPYSVILYVCGGGRPLRRLDIARRISDALWNLMGIWWSHDRFQRGTATDVLQSLVALA